MRYRNRAQIFNAVVELVSVDVIQHWHGFVSVHDPDQTMSHALLAVDNNQHIAAITNAASFLASACFATVDFPEQLAVPAIKQRVEKLAR